MKVRIFIDFWNLQLQWNHFHEKRGEKERIKIPWDKTLPSVITGRINSAAEYVGTHVYASIESGDAGLRRFLHVMDPAGRWVGEQCLSVNLDSGRVLGDVKDG